MIYPLHLAMAAARRVRAESDNAYDTQVGLVNAFLNDFVHVIDRGTANGVTTYHVYPDPNYFGSASPNEVFVAFGPYLQGGFLQSKTLAVHFFDDGSENYVSVYLSTSGMTNTLSFGSNGEIAQSLTTLPPVINKGLVGLRLGVVGARAHVNRLSTQPGTTYSLATSAYSFDVPNGWTSGRYYAVVETNDSSLLQVTQTGFRTAVYDWGRPEWVTSGVKPIANVINLGAKPGSNALQQRIGGIAWADFGGVSEADKHDQFLDAAPFGYFSAPGTNHLSVIAATQATATHLFNPYNNQLVAPSSGSFETALSSAGCESNVLQGGNPGYSVTFGTAEPPADLPSEVFWSLSKEYVDNYLDSTGIDLIQREIDLYYAEPPPLPQDLGEARARWDFRSASVTVNSGQSIRAMLDVQASVNAVPFLFSGGATVDALSAGSSRLQETQRNMTQAYHRMQLAPDSTACFFRVAWDRGTDATTTTGRYYRRRLDTEAVVEVGAPSFANPGIEYYRLYVHEWEFISESSTTSSTQRGVVFFNTSTQTVANAKQGAVFSSPYGTITLPSP